MGAEEEEMSVCDGYCRGCVYRSSAGSNVTCDHLLITGHARGCPAGAGCTRRTLGNKELSPGQLIFMLPPAPSEFKEPEKKEPRTKQTAEEAAEKSRETHRRHYWKIKAELAGKQRAALLEFKKASGYTNRTMALALGVGVGTVNGWMQESRAADWKKLEHIGCEKPEGL